MDRQTIDYLLQCCCGGICALAAGVADRDGARKTRKPNNLIIATIPSFVLLGVISRRVNTVGAVIGALSGIGVAYLFNGIRGTVEAPLDWINWMWTDGHQYCHQSYGQLSLSISMFR